MPEEERDAARIAASDYYFEKLIPRGYKHKVGRKMVFIHPWATLEERNAVYAHYRELHDKWLALHQECVLEGCSPATGAVTHRWKLVEGQTRGEDRWVKTTEEEQKRWDTAI